MPPARQRESVESWFLSRHHFAGDFADRGAAVITGRPSALASALMKISGRMDQVPQDDLREQSEMNAFFIIPIKSGFIGRLFSTHPSTENRIERLRQLEREMETA